MYHAALRARGRAGETARRAGGIVLAWLAERRILGRVFRLLAPTLLACAYASSLWAAPVDAVGDLRRRVEELGRVAAELPAALEALHDVENRVAALAREVEALGRTRAAEPDVRRVLDELALELSALERRLGGAESVLAVGGPTAGYLDGLFLRVPWAQVRLNAGVQPRYNGRLAAAGDRSSFELHHAQLQLSVALLGWIELRTMFDFGAQYLDGGFAAARDFYLDVRPLPWLVLRAGQFRPPFSRQRILDDLRLAFVDRSLATRAFAFDRDLGAMVEAAFFDDRLLVQLAITDGVEAGAQVRNDNLDFAYTARVVAQPLGPVALVEGDRARTPGFRFAVGGSFRYDLVPTDLPPPGNDLDRDGDLDNVEVLVAGAEAVARWRGLSFEGEYFYRRERPGYGRPSRDYHGGYAQGSAMVWRGLMVGARFSLAEPHALRAVRLSLAGDVPERILEAAGLVSYYFWGENVKVQLGYAYRRDASPSAAGYAPTDGHEIDLQAQAGF
jgi:hypothetical protein